MDKGFVYLLAGVFAVIAGGLLAAFLLRDKLQGRGEDFGDYDFLDDNDWEDFLDSEQELVRMRSAFGEDDSDRDDTDVFTDETNEEEAEEFEF